MNQPKCSVPFETLMLWRDGEMPPLRRAVLGRHIAGCARCQEEITIMNQITQELRQDEAASPQPMPAPLRERIIASVPAEAAAPTSAGAASTSTARPPAAPPVGTHRIKSRARWIERGALAGAGALATLVAVSIWGPHAPGASNGAPDTLAASQSESAPDASETFSSGDSAGTASTSAIPSAAGASAGGAGAAFQNEYYYDKASYQRSTDRRATDSVTSAATRSVTVNGGADALYADGHVRSSRGAQPSPERQVHRDARIGVGVTDAEESAASVESLAKGAGGFVATTNVRTGSNGLRSANLSLRVPVKKFEDVMSQLAQMGRLLSKSVSAEDLTARLSSEAQRRQVLAAQLQAHETVLKAALARQNAALKRAEDAGREGSNFEVPWQDRERVRSLRAQAALSRAKLEASRQAAEMSDIEVELRERRAAPGQASFTQEMRQTTNQALSSFAVALRAPFNSLIWILAFAPLWLPALLLLRFALKRASQEPPSE